MHSFKRNAANSSTPIYGEKPRKPGLYLGLFHGRHSKNEAMDDWGFNGPAIGPLRWCHTTYARDIKLEFETSTDAEQYFGVDCRNVDLPIECDLLKFEGKFYGDWTVYYVGVDECALPSDSFRRAARCNEMQAHRAC